MRGPLIVYSGPDRNYRSPLGAAEYGKPLSPQQTYIARRLAAGDSIEQLMAGLGIARTTLYYQINCLMVKTGARNRTHLAVLMALHDAAA